MSERRWAGSGGGGWGACCVSEEQPPCTRHAGGWKGGRVRSGEDLATRARSVSERLRGRQLSLTPLRLDSFSINSLSVDECSLVDWIFIELARSEQDSRAVR